MILTGEIKVMAEKPLPVQVGAPQIPHELTWNRNKVSTVRGRGLTAWTTLGISRSTVRLHKIQNSISCCTVHSVTCLNSKV